MVAPRNQPPLLTLVEELLAEQGRLQTPVAHASVAHDQYTAGAPRSALSAQPIPLTAPGPGEQYAFEVDLDACTGCKACVTACHSLNGLDETEAWRDVGCISGGTLNAPYQQTITTACHHCADPGCLNGCPVLAYEKDPLTGIVRHLDDQCIGCQYCILKCPYDVPKYNDRLGIVRKCDMCQQRLGAGEAPACVQACPTHAIRITKVSVSPIAERRTPHTDFLSCAPDPSYTLPTTRYLTKRTMPPDTGAVDASVLRPQPPHWPLVALLTLVPMAVGCGVVEVIHDHSSPVVASVGWIAGALGLALAGLHLGQPLRAWRVFLGLKKSWFSREAVLFGLWFALVTATVAGRIGWLPLSSVGQAALTGGTAALGVIALFCSVMIYVDTRRVFWRFANTAARFYGTATVLGLGVALTVPGAPASLGLAMVAATMLKLAFESRALAALHKDGNGLHSPARQTARLLIGPLQSANTLRVVLGLIGGILIPLAVALHAAPASAAWAALALSFLGELTERYLFFRAVDAPKMPGQPDPTQSKP